MRGGRGEGQGSVGLEGGGGEKGGGVGGVDTGVLSWRGRGGGEERGAPSKLEKVGTYLAMEIKTNNQDLFKVNHAAVK